MPSARAAHEPRRKYYLDLSQAAEGVIRRDDRFGYLKLATDPSPRHETSSAAPPGKANGVSSSTLSAAST
jgi:hypothetical protein